MDSLEIWKELRTTQGWAAIEGEIDYRVRSTMEELTICGSNDLLRLQERIKALNELKTMPEQVVHREEGQASL